MKDQGFLEKALGVLAPICLAGTICLYILAMVFGSNGIFLCGIVCAVAGIILGKKTGKDYVMVLCIILLIAISLELFMRVRDGYTGKGWYYWHLLHHPEDNAWN